MRRRERQPLEDNQATHQSQPPGGAPTGGTPVGGAPASRSGLRAAAERLLAAGDDAINRALSGNSEAFLAATRQEGGE